MDNGINYFCSNIFNAKRALEEKQNPLEVPCPEVEACNSLQEFYRNYYNSQNLQEIIFPDASIFDSTSEQHLNLEIQQEEQKQFSAFSSTRPTVEQSLEKKYNKGPLSVLWRAFKYKIPIQVATRETNCLHSVITGTCEMFDKHMNLVCSSTISLQQLFFTALFTQIVQNAQENWTNYETSFVKEKHLKHNRRNRKRKVVKAIPMSRQVERLFIKGDSIIYVQLLDSLTKSEFCQQE